MMNIKLAINQMLNLSKLLTSTRGCLSFKFKDTRACRVVVGSGSKMSSYTDPVQFQSQEMDPDPSTKLKKTTILTL